MNIKRLEIKGLYGYLDKEIDFNNDITLLVGINGSGKTSVLNIISWMVNPSLPNLCVTEFKKITLEFIFKGDDYVLTAKQTPKELRMELTNLKKNKKYNDIQVTFETHPKKIANRPDERSNLLNIYPALRPEPHEEETWRFLFKELQSPIVIGLDRNLYTEEEGVRYRDDGEVITNLKSPSRSIKSPLHKVTELASNRYEEYKNAVLSLNSRLNITIMMSSFDEMYTFESISQITNEPLLTIKQVNDLETKVKTYFKDTYTSLDPLGANADELYTKISRYFTNLKSVLNDNKNDKEFESNLLYLTNFNQFKKTRELIDEFEKFEIKTKRAYEPLRQYLEVINDFFRDSSKELYFDKAGSKIKYRILDINGEVIEEGRFIEDLSSGEKQILILFTYIKFNENKDKIFIIDEPELSLHPKWQEMLLSGIKELLPRNIQLIFATHSPSIVGDNKEYCRVLLPYKP